MNPPANSFCGACGTALTIPCGSCGRANPPDHLFCGGCGSALAPGAAMASRKTVPSHLADKILAGRAALEGERKLISALFVDLVGSTRLGERLDPEDVDAVIRTCFDLMVEEVHRYEGTVSQFTGDGILALFGAPVAHEDHALRAVRAGLGIQRRLREAAVMPATPDVPPLQARVGINSGPVVVGTISTDLHMTYTALGDTVNLASRIEQLGAPGSVTISGNTLRLVEGYFVTRDLGVQQVRGKEQAVQAHEVLRSSRRRSRLDVDGDRGLSSLVGRESELSVVLEAFERARAGHGQVVVLTGEPGIGKSRLIHELKRRLEGEDLLWVEGRCISYGRDIGYLPIIDLLKGLVEIDESDGEAEVHAKLGAGVAAHGLAVAEIAPYLEHLLSGQTSDAGVAAMDPEMRKARTFESVRALMLSADAARPVVLVVEDLHWIDRLSEELVADLANHVADRRALILLTHRPGYEAAGLAAAYTTVPLGSLSEGETIALAEAVLAAERLPAELQRIIASRADGNPFFVEEVTKWLLEQGILQRAQAGYTLARPLTEGAVPDKIQDVIQARLDRLDDEPRRALQAGAVIGREFTARLLNRAARVPGRIERHLRELWTVDLIHERTRYPELAYMFKHALTHDVAYGSLLQSRRRSLHHLVALAIEEIYADRLSEHYETLAHHFERAEIWDRALEYLLLSGEKALAAFAPRQAAAVFERALTTAERSGNALSAEQSLRAHSSLGQARFLTSDWDESVASFEAALGAARALDDRGRELEPLFQLANACLWAHRMAEAFAHAEQAHRLAGELGNQAIRAGSLAILALAHHSSGDPSRALAAADDAVSEARAAGVAQIEAIARQVHGHVDYWLGDHAGALGHWNEGLRIGREHQVAYLMLWGLFCTGLIEGARGNYDAAIAALQEELELSTRLGDRIWRSRSLNTLGWVYGELFNWELAIEYNGRCIAESEGWGDPEVIRNADLNLADCYLALGRLEEARRHLEHIPLQAERRPVWGGCVARYGQHEQATLGELWLAAGQVDHALGCADACLATAERSGSRRYIIRGRRLRGLALIARHDLAAAEPDLAMAQDLARVVANPVQLWKTIAAIGQLRATQGRLADAKAAYGEALAILEKVAADLADESLRATLLNSEQVTHLRRLLAACSV
ncbi:MAG: AAA family ATPase [Chloroflexi bacterium]|nr:AAA family ATPase [Chloroflexota bacterium]